MAEQRNLTALAFLVMAFVVVGLVGMFASFAGPLPLQRALSHEAAWDAVLEAARGPNPAEAIAKLAPRLGDPAKVLTGAGAGADPASLPGRIQAERVAARARLQAEAEAIAFRLRLLIGVVTLMAAVFGVAMATVRGAPRETR